jgi:hypothetical protein
VFVVHFVCCGLHQHAPPLSGYVPHDAATECAGDDRHGQWLYSTNLPDGSNVSSYVNTLSSQNNFLAPGQAFISHQQPDSSAGKFDSWSLDVGAAQQLLVSAQQPAKLQLLQATSDKQATDQSRINLSWRVASNGLPVEQFRLFVAADALFDELVRQPNQGGFVMDIPGSQHTAQVEIPKHGNKYSTLYVLLLACNANACSRSCVANFTIQ